VGEVAVLVEQDV